MLISISICSYSAEEFSRKFGSSPSGDLSNSIEAEDTKLSLEAKEDGGLLTTVLQLAVKFVPTLINVISGETGPSQTDRIEGIDLNVSINITIVIRNRMTHVNCFPGRGPLLLEEHCPGRPQALPGHRRRILRGK